MDSTISPRLIGALDKAWASIRTRNPDVPAVVLTLGQGSGQGRLRFGHFADGRWSHGENAVPELFVGGEGLARGSLPVLGTLLHEAAHGVACARKIQDTSRQGRFHNTRFRALANELGIEVSKDPALGWSVTSVPPATASLYRTDLHRLDVALVAFRRPEASTRSRPSSNNGVSAFCACPRRIRVAESVLALGEITCGICGEDFTPE